MSVQHSGLVPLVAECPCGGSNIIVGSRHCNLCIINQCRTRLYKLRDEYTEISQQFDSLMPCVIDCNTTHTYDKMGSDETNKQRMKCMVRQTMNAAWTALAVLDDATLGTDAAVAEDALHTAVYCLVDFQFMSKRIDGDIEYAMGWKCNRDSVAAIYASQNKCRV